MVSPRLRCEWLIMAERFKWTNIRSQSGSDTVRCQSGSLQRTSVKDLACIEARFCLLFIEEGTFGVF